MVRDGTLAGLHALSEGWARLPQDCFPPRRPGGLTEYLLVYSVSEVA